MKFKFLDLFETENMSKEDIQKWEKVDKELGDSIDLTVKEYLKDKIDEKSFKEKIDEVLKSIENIKENDSKNYLPITDFDSKMNEINETLLSLKSSIRVTNSGEIKFKSLEDQVKEQLKDFIKKDSAGNETVDLKEACKSSPGFKKQINLFLDKKDAGIVTSAGVAPSLTTTVEQGLGVIPRYESSMRKYANVTQIGTRSLVYAEYVSGEGDAEWVPEGGLKPIMDATITEKTVNSGKVALAAKLTEETLTDLPQLVAEIRAEILNKIGTKEEEDILYGSGTDGEIKGVVSMMPSFSLTGLSVSSPTIFDAIVAAYTQIISTSEMSYRPNIILINPIDVTNMRLTKDDNKQYVIPPFKIGEEIISGLRIEDTNVMDVDSFTMGDFNYLNIRDYVQLSITFGWENDDFRRNLVLMIGEKRLMAYIKSQYATAFVSDTFSNVIEAIAAQS